MTTHSALQGSDWYLPETVLATIPAPCLFYPGAACDVVAPVQIFASHVTDYWFADIAYRRERLEAEPALALDPRFRHVQSTLRGATIAVGQISGDHVYRDEGPFVLTEEYTHVPTGSCLRIHRTLRRAPSAMRNEFDKLGVFFHRCDFTEGSGTIWLTADKRDLRKRRPLVLELLQKMQSGSLIVTDGSKCEPSGSNFYSQFRLAADAVRDMPRPALDQIAPFSDPLGNRFECVGYLGLRRDTRALAWRVTKPSPS
jgi:hypothetical protein